MKKHTEPELLYKGPLDDDKVPEPVKWILDLLEKIFEGKEITTNPCEGRFGAIGMEIRRGRAIYLDRALTDAHLRKLGIIPTARYLQENYSIEEMGKRGERRNRKQIITGDAYKIVYVDRRGCETERKIEVMEKDGDWIQAYCHYRDDERTFRRSRIKEIVPCEKPME